MANREDAKLLKTTAALLQKQLRLRLSGSPIRYKQRILPEDSGTDGWCATLATLGNDRRLELWLDRFSAPGQRRFWFGACWPKKHLA
jgi:hypothetical protein